MNVVRLPSNLPNIAQARLPETYTEAKKALSTCDRIDECKDWADKAEALASYAKQSEDEEMFNMAKRIRARAIDRCGALLRLIPTAQGARNELNIPGDIKLSPREQARRAARMSQKQAANALQVNAVPRDIFENLIESADPPTAKKLAEIGKKKRQRPLIDLGKRTAKEFSAATALIGLFDELVRESKNVDVEVALRGCEKKEIQRLSRNIESSIKWMQQVNVIIRRGTWRIQDTTSPSRSTKSSKKDSRRART